MHALKQWILAQPERLRSEDSPRRPMITQIIDSYWILSGNKTNQIYKFKEFTKT